MLSVSAKMKCEEEAFAGECYSRDDVCVKEIPLQVCVELNLLTCSQGISCRRETSCDRVGSEEETPSTQQQDQEQQYT